MMLIVTSCKNDSNDEIKDTNNSIIDEPIIDEPIIDEPIIDEPIVNPDDHTCILGEWEYLTKYPCNTMGEEIKCCTICGKIMEKRTKLVLHDYIEEIIPASCCENGERILTCKNCDYRNSYVITSTGHKESEYIIDEEATDTHSGYKHKECLVCGEITKRTEFVNNDYLTHGKLSVIGTDLVDQDGEKFQLYGLSTHGLQWFGQYVNYETMESLKDNFGINVIRLSLYTSEGGYCNSTGNNHTYLYNTVVNGIDYATKLGLYVIIDWHMVGAVEVADKNPLTYVNESKEFFSQISKKYNDQDNILYEIMNEPCGTTTWQDCKDYANQVIPCIKANNPDAIVLVGNPHWSADLTSVIKSPLTGYTNIMYTYHFYAADHKNTTQVINAYAAGIPVFISEYGIMNSDGDGALDYTAGSNWLNVLNYRNISYVAWNISNSRGSASIFKEGSTDRIDVSDSNLKPWGQWLKDTYRKKAGLSAE